MNYKLIAKNWRKQNPEHVNSGIVLIWDGKAFGWKNCLRDPQAERPETIAVDVDGNIFIAKGGNDYDGAKCWLAK